VGGCGVVSAVAVLLSNFEGCKGAYNDPNYHTIHLPIFHFTNESLVALTNEVLKLKMAKTVLWFGVLVICVGLASGKKLGLSDFTLKEARYVVADDKASCLMEPGCIYMKKFMIPDINDGLVYKFDRSQPEHIRFKVRSSSDTKESADFRLRDSDESKSDVVFFAFNMNKHIKVNTE
jgi:hypothetical protein